jgi:hypothetical protein
MLNYFSNAIPGWACVTELHVAALNIRFLIVTVLVSLSLPA